MVARQVQYLSLSTCEVCLHLCTLVVLLFGFTDALQQRSESLPSLRMMQRKTKKKKK